ncbi:MAG: DUF4367 domain-containing protein [Chloroflexi bacterium]|nr:DUF4367 domain-containing protein [Chloroflexota bacterium]
MRNNIETEEQFAERFDQDVQMLLRSGGLTSQKNIDLPQDYQETLDVARQLSETRVAHLSRVRYSLRKKLIGPEDGRGVWTNSTQQGVYPMKTSIFDKIPFKGAAIAVAFMAVAIALSLSIQPVAALAGEILGQVGLFTFTDGQAIPDEWIGQKNFNNTGDGIVMPVNDLMGLSEEEAEAQAGFALYTPGYLPECFTLNSRGVLVDEQAAPTVVTAYLCSGESVYDDVFLYMHQIVLANDPKVNFEIGDAQPVKVTVRGNEGLWIEQAPIGVKTGRDGATELMPVNMLAWEEDGFYFQMQSNHLTKDEMLKVAESLQ